MKKLFALLIIALFLLAGCSSISQGTITSKDNRPGYYTSTLVCSAYNSKGGCMVYVPVQNWHPPTWWFDIAEGEDTGWVYVTESTWNQYEVGDYYKEKK